MNSVKARLILITALSLGGPWGEMAARAASLPSAEEAVGPSVPGWTATDEDKKIFSCKEQGNPFSIDLVRDGATGQFIMQIKGTGANGERVDKAYRVNVSLRDHQHRGPTYQWERRVFEMWTTDRRMIDATFDIVSRRVWSRMDYNCGASRRRHFECTDVDGEFAQQVAAGRVPGAVQPYPGANVCTEPAAGPGRQARRTQPARPAIVRNCTTKEGLAAMVNDYIQAGRPMPYSCDLGDDHCKGWQAYGIAIRVCPSLAPKPAEPPVTPAAAPQGDNQGGATDAGSADSAAATGSGATGETATSTADT